ncbi:hypothetical protein M0802_007362 [Mischocyttarus mexicanus]|nr:hypothetical protein M0802_007362 [Mischocyttarus mexicanus]
MQSYLTNSITKIMILSNLMYLGIPSPMIPDKLNQGITQTRKMKSLAIRAALAAMLVIVVTGETFEPHVNQYAIAKETESNLLNLQNPELNGYQEIKSGERPRRDANPEPSKPRPQQVPPRPPHPRLRREADPEPSKPRPQQVPPRPPHPRLRREADPEPSKPRPQQVPPRPPHPRLRREADPEPSKPRPQQVPPRPPHPRLRREADPEPSKPRPQQVPPRPQQVPPRPPHPRLR